MQRVLSLRWQSMGYHSITVSTGEGTSLCHKHQLIYTTMAGPSILARTTHMLKLCGHKPLSKTCFFRTMEAASDTACGDSCDGDQAQFNRLFYIRLQQSIGVISVPETVPHYLHGNPYPQASQVRLSSSAVHRELLAAVSWHCHPWSTLSLVMAPVPGHEWPSLGGSMRLHSPSSLRTGDGRIQNLSQKPQWSPCFPFTSLPRHHSRLAVQFSYCKFTSGLETWETEQRL